MFSIVIFAAGRGSRLGASVPKFIIEVDSTPIFMHQLRALSNVPGEIYIVCGYRAAILMQLMLSDIADDSSLKSRLTFIYNDDYGQPQTVSIARALSVIPQNRSAMFIDGDMLFSPSTVERLALAKLTTVCLREIPSADAVMATVNADGVLQRFARNEGGSGEWANLALYQPEVLPMLAEIANKEDLRHHFDLLNELVSQGVSIQTDMAEFAEVDDVDDLRLASEFVQGWKQT